jgi:hypothetical protein
MGVNYKELRNNTHPEWRKDPGMRRGKFYGVEDIEQELME